MVECIILSIDVERDRIGLGIKQLTNNPYENFVSKHSVNSIVEFTLVMFNKESVVVEAVGLQISVLKSDINTKEEISTGSKIKSRLKKLIRMKEESK